MIVFEHRATVTFAEVPGPQRNDWNQLATEVLEVENESLSQFCVCSVRPYCLLAGDAVPIMQMGPEEPSSRQRDHESGKAGPSGSFRELTVCGARPSLPNILIPKIRVRADEFAHHPNAISVVQNDEACAVLAEQILRALEVTIFSDDDAGNAEQQCRAGTHDARAESADQSQLRPIASAARVAKANCFGVRCRISTLNSQVVPPGEDLSLPVRQNGTDRQSSFAQSLLGLVESRLQ
jgi:hypothetical protein